ncbi:hypothetical protein RINTHM_13470 [Richelia intracellularis HM01]|nr:hypothetical protein RINTHM_13470 [Richelia intracellularis HM01]
MLVLQHLESSIRKNLLPYTGVWHGDADASPQHNVDTSDST